MVAQVSNLLYRGFPIRWAWEPESGVKFQVPPALRAVCRLEAGDTADWKSALREEHVSIIGPHLHAFLAQGQATAAMWLTVDGDPTLEAHAHAAERAA